MAGTSPSSERKKRQDRLLALSIGASAAVHAALVVAWAVVTFSSKPAINLDEAIVKTRLVKLGKPRDEKLLPRLPTSAPPPKVEKQAPPTPDKPAPIKPETQPTEKKPSAAEILSKFEAQNTKRPDVNDLIKQRIGEPTDEGQKDGDKAGTDLTGSLQASYNQRLLAHVEAHKQNPATLTDEERIRLKAIVAVQIDEEGRVMKAWIDTSSGNAVFDNEVLSALRRAEPLPAPPIPVRALYASGVRLGFCPLRCE